MLTLDASPINDAAAGWDQDRLALYYALIQAHSKAAVRSNPSHIALRLAAQGSGDYMKSLTAALSTLGGAHAPLAQTYKLLAHTQPWLWAKDMIESKHRVPGWGSGFVKGEPDPDWAEVESMVFAINPDLETKIHAVTDLLHIKGKHVYPNPSCWTSAAGIILGFDEQTTGYLFVQGRLLAWTESFRETMTWAK